MKFQFGENWQAFSRLALNEMRVAQSKEHFYRLLPIESLKGKRFLDIGYGQGLALCAAAEAGAHVTGIDVDPDNVHALLGTLRFFPGLTLPNHEIASILDENWVDRHRLAGGYDIVYAWGVLHHTGRMWGAMKNGASLVREGGTLVIAIYKRHWTSPIWLRIKQMYNLVPRFVQRPMAWFLLPVIFISKFLATRTNPLIKERGMSFYFDVIDWVGGYPYEYADPDEIVRFLRPLGFEPDLIQPDRTPTGIIEYRFVREGA